jgi:hypothetical protein
MTTADTAIGGFEGAAKVLRAPGHARLRIDPLSPLRSAPRNRFRESLASLCEDARVYVAAFCLEMVAAFSYDANVIKFANKRIFS